MAETKTQNVSKGSEFSYVIDSDNKIVSVNTDWLSFARENRAPNLAVSEDVIGRSLFDFVSDKETRHLYQMIIERVRNNGETVTIPFRCDSPSLRRFMELEISQQTNSWVQFVGRIIREESRTSVSLFDPEFPRSSEFVVVCSWCKRVNVSGEWLEVEHAVNQMEIFNQAKQPRITHGICSDCSERMLGGFKKTTDLQD